MVFIIQLLLCNKVKYIFEVKGPCPCCVLRVLRCVACCDLCSHEFVIDYHSRVSVMVCILGLREGRERGRTYHAGLRHSCVVAVEWVTPLPSSSFFIISIIIDFEAGMILRFPPLPSPLLTPSYIVLHIVLMFVIILFQLPCLHVVDKMENIN